MITKIAAALAWLSLMALVWLIILTDYSIRDADIIAGAAFLLLVGAITSGHLINEGKKGEETETAGTAKVQRQK